MGEQLTQATTDKDIAAGIVFDVTHRGHGTFYDEDWVDVEVSDLAERCAVEGITTGRRLERKLIADALGLDIEEIESLVAQDSAQEESTSVEHGLATDSTTRGNRTVKVRPNPPTIPRPAMKPGKRHG